MEWLIKTNLALVLLAAVYRLCLKGTVHFTFNRFFLLVTPVIAATLPLFPGMMRSLVPVYTFMLAPVSIGASVLGGNHAGSVFSWLAAVYWAGAGLSLIAFLVKLYRTITGFEQDGSAYSFFKKIHIPDTTGHNRRMMLLHEQAHARLWHSADVILFRLLQCLYWFNPAVYYLSAAVKEENEFSADRYATQRLRDKTAYCELLLNETFGTDLARLTNPFHHSSSINKRIVMITQTNPQRISGWKYVALLPLLAALILLSGIPQQIVAQNANLENSPAGEPDEQPQFKGDLFRYLSQTIRYPESARKDKAEGKVLLKLFIDSQGKVSKVENLSQKADSRLAEEAIRVVSAMPDWKPAMKDGKPAAAELVLPVSFKL